MSQNGTIMYETNKIMTLQVISQMSRFQLHDELNRWTKHRDVINNNVAFSFREQNVWFKVGSVILQEKKSRNFAKIYWCENILIRVKVAFASDLYLLCKIIYNYV